MRMVPLLFRLDIPVKPEYDSINRNMTSLFHCGFAGQAGE